MGSLCSGCFAADKTFPRKEGRYVNRTFTDWPAAILFTLFVAGMALIVAISFRDGNPRRLTHGANWKGEICGIDAAVKDLKYMMFCGSPERAGKFPKYIIEGSTACVEKCPTDVVVATSQMQIDCLMPAFHNFTSYRGGSIGGSIPNVETLEMTLTQSVSRQYAYPTSEWGGRFCLPGDENPALRAVIIDGPWGQYYRPMLSVGGLMDAWPLMLISAGVACLFGYAYLGIMAKYAGPIIFATMVMSTLLALAMGVMFFLAIVFDMDDTDSDYCKLNPIMSLYVGEEAKIYSIVTGVIIILSGVVLGAATVHSMAHIDEMMGLVDLASQCLAKGFPLMMFPLFQSAILFGLIVFFVFLGLPWVASMGELGNSEINVNGVGIQGLQRVWKRDTWQHIGLWYYLIGLVYLFEFYLQVGHYVVSYAVATWYFQGGVEKPKAGAGAALDKALKGAAGTESCKVRVAGADAIHGQREGRTFEGPGGQKYLVVTVEKKGPGLGRHDEETSTFVKESMPMTAVLQGYISLMFHVGTIALGAPFIFVLRPFRLFSQCATGLLTRTADPDHGPGHSDDPHSANIKGTISLLSACLDQVFGKYSKNAFTELVLCGGGNGESGFFECSEQAFSFLVKSGGSVAHLHGAMLMYEIFGVLFITLLCGWMSLIVQDKVDWFNDKTSSYYIEDKTASFTAAMLVAFAVAFSWMSMWVNIADSLLYCVAWNRRQLHEGHEHNMNHHDIIGEVQTYCPMALRQMLPDHEMSAAHEHGLHAHGLGQQGAILAAMEHGAMSSPHGQAPDYGKTLAQGHTLATRMLG